MTYIYERLPKTFLKTNMHLLNMVVRSTPMSCTVCILVLVLACTTAFCSPPEDPVKCTASGCTVTNTYGAFPDRSTCRASDAVFPASEAEVVDAVAKATKAKRKMRMVTRYSHSIPKLVCPGGDDDGLIISTRYLDRVVRVDESVMLMTVESGMVLKDLIEEAAKAGLVLPYVPYWSGVTVGGMLGTGAHGSSLWGKGSAVHEYVEGLRIVSPASASEGYARVRSLDAGHPDLDAVKVSLGVLGVITQVTLKLQPVFKRSITYSERKDTDLADVAAAFGEQHEFADIRWYPGHRKAVYRIDDRASSNAQGNGLYDFIGFRSTATLATALTRSAEEISEATGDANAKCINAAVTNSVLSLAKYGLRDGGNPLTGYPVVGLQNLMQASGGCLSSPEDGLLTSCPWDPRLKEGLFIHQTTVSIGLPKVRDFIRDVQKLRDLDPNSLCGVELYDGILMRYVKASSAFLGKQEDALDFDITYYRSRDPMAPRMFEDTMEEIEQMAVIKYGGLPHWGKNRNLAFDGVVSKYRKSGEFLRTKDAYDRHGLFSNEWTDQLLGIKGGGTSIYRKGCALEGLCICSEDLHCAPDKGYVCRPGRVYSDARVCTRSSKK